VHGGDRAVSADQLERLVPGTWLVEQGSYDRGDVGAGDSARGGTGGGASRILPVAGASMRPPGRTIVQSRSRARRSASAAVFAVMQAAQASSLSGRGGRVVSAGTRSVIVSTCISPPPQHKFARHRQNRQEFTPPGPSLPAERVPAGRLLHHAR
jgi:hypothetical protein